jgi:hypothetical protein
MDDDAGARGRNPRAGARADRSPPPTQASAKVRAPPRAEGWRAERGAARGALGSRSFLNLFFGILAPCIPLRDAEMQLARRNTKKPRELRAVRDGLG